MPPVNLLLKPASSACNLACRYCFYKDVSASRSQAFEGMLSRQHLEAAIRSGLSYADGCCSFTFQGGEPTLAGLPFYKETIRLQKQYARSGVQIQNAIQTNGYLLDDAWAEFLGEHRFLVGLSLDGPAELHDKNRLDNQGRGTFQRVMHTVQLLKKYHVSFNILCVVTGRNARAAERIYNFYRRQGFGWLQFIPCIEPPEQCCRIPGLHLSAKDYGIFLTRIFDLWYQDLQHGKYISIRHLDNWLAILLGGSPEACNMSGHCSVQFVVEGDGGVYPCDFYAYDEWRLGTVGEEALEQLLQCEKAAHFVKASHTLPEQCAACRWLLLCRNGCRRDREILPDGRPGLNRFCEAYLYFFSQKHRQLKDAVRLLLHIRSAQRNTDSALPSRMHDYLFTAETSNTV